MEYLSIDGMTIFKFALKNKAWLDASLRGWGVDANFYQHGTVSSVFVGGEKFLAYRNKYTGFKKGFGVFELVTSCIRSY